MRGAALFAALLLAGAASAQELPAPSLADCDASGFQRLLRPAAQTGGDARGFWLDRRLIRWPGRDGDGRFRLYHSAAGQMRFGVNEGVVGAEGFIELQRSDEALPEALAARFAWLGSGALLALPDADQARLPELLRGQLLLVHESSAGALRDATALQPAGALDDLYAAAEAADDLGARPGLEETGFALWAPSARGVALCLYPEGDSPASDLIPLQRDPATGIWRGSEPGDLSGAYYTYLVDVFVRGIGIVRNRVTDPYALSLTTDSRRAYVANLQDPALMPPRWLDKRGRRQLEAPTDMVIYELHVRDFSASDASVRPEWRGKYLAFAEDGSDGMRHLRAMAAAGLTDVHLLPVFDLATVPETGCITPSPSGAPDSEAQQALIGSLRERDCFNWGYDPWHFTAPEGSYATDPADGAVRVREFRAMVQGLHDAGLRVGMDVVYNHTSASGQNEKSVLDRIVPGYYHRYDLAGRIERSTCCENTATENRMMAKLMIDSIVVWARDYRIDSFRFDLMGHQPREVMLELQARVNQAVGRHVELLGEGWNFGEVVDNRRFVQAAQHSLNGTGIATFSDRGRDAARGGGCCDGGDDLVVRQGFLNGLHYAPNAMAGSRFGRLDLMRAADLVRVGLAGSVRSFEFTDHRGLPRRLEQVDYVGMPAGYVAEPTEVVNYVENHDNPTLFDIGVMKLPVQTPPAERARVQMLGAAIVALSQGIAYYHAGVETLRSKSLDRNSYDSGDWFNRLDWTFSDNNWGVGLPPAWDNASAWYLMRPRLAEPSIRPAPEHIRWMRDAFLDLLRIRASSSLLRLRSAADIRQRLRLLNTGPGQVATAVAGHLDGEGYPGAGFRELVYFINVDLQAHSLNLPELAGRDWRLHPVQRGKRAADARPREQAAVESSVGRFTLPPRSAVVWVLE